ncbi:MAG: DNA/RNA nuclease SfsA [Eubacterium sp.]|nr:DNA/RNA nuclease SfsA [Eubacterium sp.]
MNYNSIKKGKFLNRPNRFTAQVEIDGEEHIVHVKNTGRCKELLVPGATIFLEKSSNPLRKTQYDLIAVYKGKVLVNMDSQAPNKAVGEWIKNGGLLENPTIIKPETKYGDSRLDFYIENEKEKMYAEVKGVTLEVDGVAKFPDAPTERGRKHLGELIKAKQEGYRAAAIFVIQMKGCKCFTPNTEHDPAFAEELKRAYESGVEIIAVDCKVTPESITIDKKTEVLL